MGLRKTGSCRTLKLLTPPLPSPTTHGRVPSTRAGSMSVWNALAIYRHTHRASTYCWASAGCHSCKTVLKLVTLGTNQERLCGKKLMIDLPVKVRSWHMRACAYTVISTNRESRPAGTCRPKHMQPHIQCMTHNGLDELNISIQVKNKKAKACRTAVRCWEICVLSAHWNHNSWDDKALPLNCLFHYSSVIHLLFILHFL